MNLPEFVIKYLKKAKECNNPVSILLQTPRKGEMVSGDMEEVEFELHEFATIHICLSETGLNALYKYKIENKLDIISFFPDNSNNRETLVDELKTKDAYEVIERY